MIPGIEVKATGVRRIESPVFIDRRGTVWAPGLIDVTLRHRDRVVLAESPPPGMSAELARSLREAASRFAGARGGFGAFTVSFLAEPANGEHRFLGTAPGLPQAIAVVEALDEADLTALESHLARGGTLEAQPPEARGHAFQVCLSALDPEDDFAPSPGVVEALRLPSGPGLRADPAVEEGEVPGEEIVRVTAHGRTRAEALARLQRGLARTEVFLRGGGTDKAFLSEVLDRPELTARAPVDPCWLDRLVAGGEHLPQRGAEAALLAAAVGGYEAELDLARDRFYASAARGRLEVPKEAGRTVELLYRGQEYVFDVARLEWRLFRVEVDGRRLEVLADRPGRTGRRLACGDRSWHVSLAGQANRLTVEVDGIPHRLERREEEVVRSPAPGVVASLRVQAGDEVAAGAPLAVLEAMKTETTVAAPRPGRVRKILTRRNAQVAAGAPLLVLEAAGGRSPAPEKAARVRFESLIPPEDGGASPRAASLTEARRLMLGYDADLDLAQRLASGAAAAGSAEDRRLEEEILRAFADVSHLFGRQAARGDGRHSTEEYLAAYLRGLDAGAEALPEAFLARLRRALAHYGVGSLDRSPELEESLFRTALANRRLARQVPAVLAVLEGWMEGEDGAAGPELRELLDRLIAESQGGEPAVHDLAREVRYRRFDRPVLLGVRERIYAAAEADLAHLAAEPEPEERARRLRSLVECPQPLHRLLSRRYESAAPHFQEALLEVMVRRYYRIRELRSFGITLVEGQPFAVAGYEHRGSHVHLIATHTAEDRRAWAMAQVSRLAAEAPAGSEIVADLYSRRAGPPEEEDAVAASVAGLLAAPAPPEGLRRVAFVLFGGEATQSFTFRRAASEDGDFREERVYRGIHPMLALRLELWRLQNFQLERLPAPDRVYFFHGVARDNPRDERLFSVAEVRDLTPVRDEAGRVVELPQLEHMLMEALAGIRRFQSRRAAGERLQWNRVLLNLWPPVELTPDDLDRLVRRLAPLSEGLGLEKVAVRCRIPDRESGELLDRVLEFSSFDEAGVVLRFRKPSVAPLKPLREYAQRVVDLRRRGLPYPYEVIKRLAPSRGDAQADLPPGELTEHDLDAAGRLAPVDRPYGRNTAGVVVGVVRSFTGRHPEGMARVILLGDPSFGMGALAEPECRRILAALDLAAELRVPVEWFALSAGARISMHDGTEAMDWIGRVLRRIVELTQAGGEINVIVAGVNAGAQPYWNAEATMLMHTRGILIMTPEGAMVLTGKQALAYSGGVPADDNQALGGYEGIMGPNGQAQYFARDLDEACHILYRHYDRTYVAPGERFPRPWPSRDPRERDVRGFPHGGELATVGDIFSPAANPARKKPFEIRRLMEAVSDQDLPPLERWYGMHDAEIAVVWDACLGGHAVCLLGFESKPLPRLGAVPGFGPEQWTGGTLFPLAAKKVARAINAASGNRPLVVLANLSGFDGSPESMRLWQLEYGAEIGRAVVRFAGPIVFCVVSRYHGGAFVVFSHTLHDNMEVAAVEGAYASVIGGAPAAAVVFSREVDRRARQDPRILELEQAVAGAEGADKAALRARRAEALESVRSEKLSEVAEEFDAVHSVERARQVGSVHHIIAPERLRPYLIEAVERGMAREEGDRIAEATFR